MEPAPISTIPPEILSQIFKYVHSEYLITHDLKVPGPQDQKRDESDDDSNSDSDRISISSTGLEDPIDVEKLLEVAKDPTFFPYSVASVCRFWEDVLSSTPEFWTFLVFFLDMQCTSREKVKKYLSWSRDLPIDILMTRRPDLCTTPWVAAILETPVVRENMKFLMPHFHRCRVLHVDVSLNISLPILPSRIRTETTLLQNLSFTSDIGLAVWDKDDRKHNFLVDIVVDDSDGDSAFEFRPQLNTLNIDGRNLQRALAEEKPWILEQDDLEELTISQYVPVAMSPETCASEDNFDFHKCDACRLDLYQALETIESWSSLVSLKFDMVHFDISPSDHDESIFDLSFLTHLAFQDIAPEIIDEIFRVCSFDEMDELESLTFIHCSDLHLVEIPEFRTPTLCLLGLGDDVKLELIVKDWSGDSLLISCCSSFSDDFLELLAAGILLWPDDDEEGKPKANFTCNEMTALDIHFIESPPFSVSALRKMIKSRSCDVDYSDIDWRQNTVWGPAIMRLHVSGRVPELSQEDEVWFRSRMLDFSWGTD